MKRVSKKKRDWLMSQSETLMLSPTSCIYLGERYKFIAVTEKEGMELIGSLIGQMDFLRKP